MGNIKSGSNEIARAKFEKYAKRDKKKQKKYLTKSKSVRTVAGGAPGLGKKR